MPSEFDTTIAGTDFEAAFGIFEQSVVYQTAAGAQTTIDAIVDFADRQDQERIAGGKEYVAKNTVTVFNEDVAEWGVGDRIQIGSEWFGVVGQMNKDHNRTKLEVKRVEARVRSRSLQGEI